MNIPVHYSQGVIIYLKAKDVSERTSISIPHIRRMARDGKFQANINY